MDQGSISPQVNKNNIWFEQIEQLVDSRGCNFFRVIAISFLSLHLLVLARNEHRKWTSELAVLIAYSLKMYLDLLTTVACLLHSSLCTRQLKLPLKLQTEEQEP